MLGLATCYDGKVLIKTMQGIPGIIGFKCATTQDYHEIKFFDGEVLARGDFTVQCHPGTEPRSFPAKSNIKPDVRTSLDLGPGTMVMHSACVDPEKDKDKDSKKDRMGYKHLTRIRGTGNEEVDCVDSGPLSAKAKYAAAAAYRQAAYPSGYGNQEYEEHNYDDPRYNGRGYGGQGYGKQGYGKDAYDDHGYGQHGYGREVYNEHGYDDHQNRGRGHPYTNSFWTIAYKDPAPTVYKSAPNVESFEYPEELQPGKELSACRHVTSNYQQEYEYDIEITTTKMRRVSESDLRRMQALPAKNRKPGPYKV